MDEARLLAAITKVRDAVRLQADQDKAEVRHRVDAIRTVAGRVKASYVEEIGQLKARIDANLLPVEPLRQTWNVFRIFDIEYQETRWTQWFAGILRPETGQRCSRLAWLAFCDAVSRRAAIAPPSGLDNIADATHWRTTAAEVPLVEDEVHDAELGRLDMMVTTPSIIAAIENKLWAHWHDGPIKPQADRYREMAQKRLVGDRVRRLGLVLLSQRDDLQQGSGYPSDYVHVSWRDVGQALRRVLRQEWSSDQQAVIELSPLLLTLVSLEQDLLELSLVPTTSPPSTMNQNERLKKLSALATYLEER